jgi:hypothetical protein
VLKFVPFIVRVKLCPTITEVGLMLLIVGVGGTAIALVRARRTQRRMTIPLAT